MSLRVAQAHVFGFHDSSGVRCVINLGIIDGMYDISLWVWVVGQRGGVDNWGVRVGCGWVFREEGEIMCLWIQGGVHCVLHQ